MSRTTPHAAAGVRADPSADRHPATPSHRQHSALGLRTVRIVSPGPGSDPARATDVAPRRAAP